MTWNPCDGGLTIGDVGSEGGILELDEEHPRGARISLESGGNIAPFAVTCGIYGWMAHTRFFPDLATASHEVSLMKSALERILATIPDRDLTEEESREVVKQVASFVEQFP